MRKVVLILCGFWMLAPARAGYAPESVEGMVLRTYFSDWRIRNSHAETIVFESPDRFYQLKYAELDDIREEWASGLLLRQPRGGGSYRFQRMTENSAALTLEYDSSGEPTSRKLVFETEIGGTVSDKGEEFVLVKSRLRDAPALNISLRGNVSAGHPLIAGFVVPEGNAGITRHTSRDVLIRVVGPSLEKFGVEGFWADPEFKVVPEGRPFYEVRFSGNYYGDWGNADSSDLTSWPFDEVNEAGVAAFTDIFKYLGGFPLDEGSKDAVMILRLQPDAYTVVATAEAGDPGGEALIEVYFLP